MLLRTVRMLLICVLAILCAVTIQADPPGNDADWLTWTVKDCKNNTLDLSDHENKTVYVIVFSPGNSDSCMWMRTAATYIRAHANKADRVLGFCSDDSGCDAIKLHIRQEEWKKRIDTWNAAQEAARLAAQQAGQPYQAPATPDYVKQIQDEMNDPEDFEALIGYHVPFKTVQRHNAMWTWLTERMASLPSAPRLLKINAAGHLVQEWTTLPDPFNAD